MTTNHKYRPSGYYVSQNTSLEEVLALEAQDAIERSECEAWEEEFMIRWITQGGQQIKICLDQTLAGEFGFNLSVDGNDRFYAATDIKPVANVPGIVSKIGNVGLSEERRDALRAIWERRSKWRFF